VVVDDRIAFVTRSDPHAGYRTYLSEDPGYTTVVDGWLTNVDELKRRYCVEDADNCASVVCAGYRAEGTEVLKRLKGSYSLVIVHRDGSDKLLMARDMFASRPLYYAVQGGNFWFGTEIKAILQDHTFKREISTDAFAEILAYGTSVGPGMPFKDMWKVIPGQYVSGAPRRRLQAEWFCTSDDPQARDRDDDAWARDIWDALVATVDRQCTRCPDSAVLLSGGVDSSLVALALAEVNGGRSSAITIGSPEWEDDETKYAKDIASHCGLGIRSIQIGADDGILDALAGVIWKLEEPTRFYNAIPLEVAAVQQEGLRRGFFTGEGADMMFGSPAHERAEWILRLNNLPKWALGGLRAIPSFMFRLPRIGRTLKDLQRLHVHFGSIQAFGVKGHLFNTEIVGPDFEGTVPAHVEDLAARIAAWPADIQTTFIILLGLAYNWNERFEKIGAHTQIDMFHPFQTHEMLSLSMQMPMKNKVAKHIGKPLLRKIVADKLSPDVPRRRKIQLSAPMWSWWNESSDLRDAVLQLRDPASPVREYLNVAAMDSALKEYETGQVDNARLSRMLFIMLGLDLWLKMFVDGQSVSRLNGSHSSG
jgi:asparagine synthase (glutamine-hydrolysing)